MAYYAKLDDNNIVLEVLSVNNEVINNLPFPESEQPGIDFLTQITGYSNWKQTSYNANFRKNYAGIGYAYSPILNAFISPQPFASWSLDEATCQWNAPTPYPDDGNSYYWDEQTLSWVEYA